MRHGTVTAAMVALALVVCVCASAQLMPGDTPGTANLLGGTGPGIGIRALGMGGATTAFVGDATALYWNPAGLGRVHGFEWVTPFGATADGIDVLDELQDIWDSIDKDNIDPSVFDSVRDVAVRNNGDPVTGNAGFMSGVAVHNIGVGAFGEGAVDATITYTPGATETLDLNGIAAWTYSAGAGYALSLTDSARVGIGVRKVWMGYQAQGYQANRTAGAITKFETFNTGTRDDDDIAVDLGFQFKSPEGLMAGVAIKNVNSPDFFLADNAGNGVRLKVDPTINVGLAVNRFGMLIAADVHNLSSANGSEHTFHLGAEKQLSSNLIARAGYTEGNFILGLGAKLGAVCLNLAVDGSFEDTAGLEASLNF